MQGSRTMICSSRSFWPSCTSCVQDTSEWTLWSFFCWFQLFPIYWNLV